MRLPPASFGGCCEDDDLGEACRWGTAAGSANALTWMPGELDPKEMHKLAAAVQVEKL